MLNSRFDKWMRGVIWLPSYLFAITVLSSLSVFYTIIVFLFVMFVLDSFYLNIFLKGFYSSKQNWCKFLVVFAIQLLALALFFYIA